MIILYGSYAKNTYVEHDIRDDYGGGKTEYNSDYDILVVTKRRLGEREGTVETRVREKFAVGKSEDEITKVQIINESIAKLNNALSMGHCFYVEAVAEGVLLYDSSKGQLATPRNLNYSEINKIAQKYYESNKVKIDDYWEDAIRNIESQKYTHSSFFLHQVTEYLIKAIPLVFTLYRYKEHELTFLLSKCKKHTSELTSVFPCNTPKEKHLFDLLRKAYVEARYNDDFVVTKEEINVLRSRIEILKPIVEKVCRQRLDYYVAQIKK